MAPTSLVAPSAGFAWPMKEPPLVQRHGQSIGVRQRLRGPALESLRQEHRVLLSRTATTVSESGNVRFGDQLLLLNHATEVVLQADLSRKEAVIDESHSQRKQFEAFLVTTGKVLQPCARNCFTVVRANRSDGFGDSLDVHFGQEIRILASSFVSDKVLYLHLQDDPPIENHRTTRHAALLPRASSRTLWRIVEAPPPEQSVHGTMRAPDPSPLPGQAVRVNDRISFRNVETGHLLMSDLRLVTTGFGVECSTFAEALENINEMRTVALSHDFGSGTESDGRLCAVWSFVNDAWVDQVDDAKSSGIVPGENTWTWKEDEGDDFKGGPVIATQPDPVEFNPLEGEEKKLFEQEHRLLAEDPRTKVCKRISLALRSRGVHFIRKMRRMCEESDVVGMGIVPAHTFEGILAARVIRLTASEFKDISEVFEASIELDSDVVFVDYGKFFWFLEGILPEDRLDSVRRAYRKLQTVASANYVDVKTLMEHWNPECSREVQDGTMDCKEACQEFIAQWDAANADGHISPEEFLRYYRDVSLCYEDGAEFVEMLRVAWDL